MGRYEVNVLENIVALFSTNNNTFHSDLAQLLKFYQNEDLVLGGMLCDSLGIKSQKQITEADLQKYINQSSNSNNNQTDPETIKRTLGLAKLFILLHAKSASEYRLPTDIKIAVMRQIKSHLNQDQRSELALLNTEEHDNRLFGYMEDTEIFSIADINNFIQSICQDYSNSYGILEKLNYIQTGKKISKAENAVKDGVEQLAKIITGGFLGDAFNDKDKPKDRQIMEKDFFVDPKGSSLEKMFDAEQRKTFKDSLELLKDLKPKANARGEIISGEQLYSKFNTATRKLLEEYRDGYTDEKQRDQLILKMQFIAVKLASVLRQNNFPDISNDLLTKFAVKNAKDEENNSAFKKKTYFSKEEINKKTKEFYAKFKASLGFKKVENLLHDKNSSKPLPKEIAEYVNSKPILDKAIAFGSKLDVYPDVLDARRKFANRLSKLRTALLNYESASDLGAQIGGDVAAEVVPMSVLFDEFKKNYDKLYDRVDTKYFDITKIVTDRKTELDRTKEKLHNMGMNLALRKTNFELALKNIKTKQREKQVASSEELKDLESLPEKLLEIKRLQEKLNEAGKLFSNIGVPEKITGEQVVKVRDLEKECDELYAKTTPPKSTVPQQQQQQAQQQQQQQDYAQGGYSAPALGN